MRSGRITTRSPRGWSRRRISKNVELIARTVDDPCPDLESWPRWGSTGSAATTSRLFAVADRVPEPEKPAKQSRAEKREAKRQRRRPPRSKGRGGGLAIARPLYSGAKGEARSDLCGAPARDRDCHTRLGSPGGCRDAQQRHRPHRAPSRGIGVHPLTHDLRQLAVARSPARGPRAVRLHPPPHQLVGREALPAGPDRSPPNEGRR